MPAKVLIFINGHTLLCHFRMKFPNGHGSDFIAKAESDRDRDRGANEIHQDMGDESATFRFIV